jgi:hypothetical protein
LIGIESLINLKKEERCKVISDKKNHFHKIFPHSEKSPRVMWISDDQYIVYYPAFSKKYTYEAESKCRFIEVLQGVIFDERNNKKYTKGERIKLTSSETAIPYTQSVECYLRVSIADCNETWENVLR